MVSFAILFGQKNHLSLSLDLIGVIRYMRNAFNFQELRQAPRNCPEKCPARIRTRLSISQMIARAENTSCQSKSVNVLSSIEIAFTNLGNGFTDSSDKSGRILDRF
jgi:hypothetical protein